MTKLLEEAITKIEELPDKEQDIFAKLILEELADEARWDAAFTKSPDVLEQLAAEAEEEDKAGLSEDLDPDKL